MTKNSLTPGNKIRRGRLAKGLTQEQLAEQLNDALPNHHFVERTMISRWEADQHFPRQLRRDALEQILDVRLGNPPVKPQSAALYIKYQEQMQDRLRDALHGCKELWFTSANAQSGVWHDMASLSRTFEKLRLADSCLVKELFYIQTLDDIKRLKTIAEAKYPSYRLSARIAPGQPLPILYIPDKQLGIILSGFGDDVRNVGLEMSGEIATFAEHTFRYRWVYSVKIVDNVGKVRSEKIKHLHSVLKDLGGSTDKIINIR